MATKTQLLQDRLNEYRLLILELPKQSLLARELKRLLETEPQNTLADLDRIANEAMETSNFLNYKKYLKQQVTTCI